MRGWTVTLIVFLCAVVVGVAYHFLVVAQLDKKLQELRAEDQKLEKELNALIQKEAEIPHLVAQLPSWRGQVDLYRAAIPSEIQDEVFLGYLTEELHRSGVQLLTVQVNLGGFWLGKMREAETEKLAEMGIDVEAAQKLRVAFYAMQLNGPYEGVIQAFENMKRYRRIYGIDQVISPSGGAGGQVVEIVDEARMPMQVTGKIFYGIPDNYVNPAELEILEIALAEYAPDPEDFAETDAAAEGEAGTDAADSDADTADESADTEAAQIEVVEGTTV